MQVARMLGVATSSVSKWIDEGRLPAARTPGGHRRIDRDALKKFLGSQNWTLPEELASNGPTVLLAYGDKERGADLAEELRRQLEGWQVLLACDAFSAGELVAAHAPQVVVLDANMRGLDVTVAIQRIKANRRMQKVHIIVLASKDRLGRPAAARWGRGVGFVPKGRSPAAMADELSAKIRRL